MPILKSARARIFLALVIIIVGAVSFVIWRHHVSVEKALQGGAEVTGVPSISAVPGSEKASQKYVEEQHVQNAQEVQAAVHNAGSAVPTVTRSSFQGDLSDFEEDGGKHVCPMTQNPDSYFKPDPRACTIENLKRAHDAGVNAQELRCQNCACPNLKAAGYTSSNLRDAGMTATQLRDCGFSLEQLIAAGFSAKDLKAAGFTAAELKAAGFTAAQLKDAGFTAAELKAAGFTAAQLRAAGFTAAELKAAGFTAAELKAAGFSAAELKDAGFTAAELKAAGFTAAQLRDAGFTAAELKAAGFTAAELAALQKESNACNPDVLKKERAAGISAIALKEKGCSAADLKAAGFTAAELKAAGFTAAELKAAGFSAKDLKDAGFTAAELKAAGFSAAELKAAGFTAAELKAAGFSAKELKDAGFTAAQLKAAGFTAAQLKAAGFSAAQLRAAGFTAAELKAAGFTAAELKAAGFSAAELKAAGFSAAELRAAGFTAGDLLRAGFTPAEAGIVAGQENAGKVENLCSVDSLRKAKLAGVSVSVLQKEGCSDAALRAAGFIIPGGINSSMQLPSISGDSETARLDRIRQLQMLQASIRERRNMLQTIQQQMTTQANQLLQDWSKTGQQQYAAATADSKNGGENGGGSAGDLGTAGEGPIYKAGTVMFGVIETAINSDEPSPILAEIVSGPLKGSKLIGQFSRVDTKLLISFNVLNIPSLDKTISLNAVAIDANTARTAVAGEVNNHYLLRYGSLFASSFLSGYANAISQQGSSSFCLLGACMTSHGSMSTSQEIAVALGNVGTQYASTMSGNFSTPPTIKVPAGAGIGVLLMTDLQIPLQEPTLPNGASPMSAPSTPSANSAGNTGNNSGSTASPAPSNAATPAPSGAMVGNSDLTAGSVS